MVLASRARGVRRRSNLWRGFLCCIVCVFSFTAIHTLQVCCATPVGAVPVLVAYARVVLRSLHRVQNDPPFQDTLFKSGRKLSWEICNFMVLGVFMGVRALR